VPAHGIILGEEVAKVSVGMDPFYEGKRLHERVAVAPQARIGIDDTGGIIPEHPRHVLAADHVVHDEV